MCYGGPLVITSSPNQAIVTCRCGKACFLIDSAGMRIDPAKFAWESVGLEPRDHNRFGGIKPVSGPLAFQRLR